MSSSIDIKNKKAKFEFEFIEVYTAGIQLMGTEIKSIRNNKASIAEAYGVIIKNELFIRNMYIGPYENGTHYNHEDKRDRKPHLKTWSDGWRHLTFLFFHAPKWLFFIPGLSLLSIGLFLYILTIKGTFMLSARMNLDIFMKNCFGR